MKKSQTDYIGKTIRTKINRAGVPVGIVTKVMYTHAGMLTTSEGWNLFSYEFEVLAVSKKDLEIKRNALMSEVSAINERIAWMEETENEECDENEFKVWKTLSIIESKAITKIEKMKAIAKVINE